MIPTNYKWMLHRLRKQFSLRRKFTQLRTIVMNWRRFWLSYRNYKHLIHDDKGMLIKNLYPRLGEDTAETKIDPTYFYQNAWAFAKIANSNPSYHVDVGSHHTYVALLSTVVPVTMVDIRPLSLSLPTLTFRKGDILNLPFPNESIPSLSSLCVIEHIGLGRYGDQLDPLGTEKAIVELKRVLMTGGSLYLSVPIDSENRTYFNAHRSFREDYLFSMFAPLRIVERRYIFGTSFSEEPAFGFGTGCYHLQKI